MKSIVAAIAALVFLAPVASKAACDPALVKTLFEQAARNGVSVTPPPQVIDPMGTTTLVAPPNKADQAKLYERAGSAAQAVRGRSGAAGLPL